jgi:hydrogenase nickel incorporation protein HypB
MVCSVTEGEDKPLKYPVMFRSVDAVLINKTDLLPHLELDIALLEHNIRVVNPRTTLLRMSARTGDGLDEWFAWLDQAIAN